ncbi:amino acid adenylation domain-containing protein [Stenotrophomonas sp. NPDC077464]|uniref:amino acid adenylation domain-containing protein n=1 Tax=unclassified Stenotrophomonas TaxID=196198 RepID=UPI0037D0C2C5
MKDPRPVSPFARLGHAGPASRTHAVVIRLSTQAALHDIELRLNAQHGEHESGHAALVVERVQWAADSDQARERRTRECSRPLAGGPGQELRATLLHFDDGERDLVVVADRTRLDQQALQRVALSLLGQGCAPATRGADRGASPEAAQLDLLMRAQLSALPALPDSAVIPEVRCLEVAVDAELTPEQWLAALALVLQRCHGATAPAVAVARAAPSVGNDAVAPLQPECYQLVDLAMPPEKGTHGVVQVLQGRLAHAPWITDALLTALSARSQTPVEVAIGILFAAPAPSPCPGAVRCDYVSGHAPVFPLTLYLADPTQPGLVCRYDGSRYSASTVDWLLRCVRHVALQIGAADQDVDAVQLLADADLRRIAALGHGGRPPSAVPRRIEEVFAEQVMQRPDATALTEGARSLTYAEVDAQSRHLAAHLTARGVVAGSFVGLCLPRSLDVVVAMLAVLRCGATYVPMDPDYPAERLRYTAQDASLTLVITLAGAHVDFDVPTVDITALTGSSAASANASAGVHWPDSQAAYIIYTSGSTGRPKGVVVPHCNVLDLLRATQQEFALVPSDTWTLFHSSAFDFSVWEIWGCLLTGAHLVIVPHGVSRDPVQFIGLINQHGVTVLNQTPSAFYQLIDADQRDRIANSLRLVIFGGEALDMQLLLPWFDRHPPAQCRLVNMFGITETTVHVTWHDVKRGDALRGSRSVGRALPGWHLYVMNGRQQLLPPGSVGEIHVGGVGVASCYHNRPDLTASRFLPDPYTGGVMYRSGDCGRLGADGSLEHLGRLDSQVKVRGFRIELDEIRRVMLEYPGVKAAAVLLNQPDPRDAATARIDAYVVIDDADIAGLRDRAAHLLPAHMMPAAIVKIERMPMTVNGKLDTEQLRTLQASVPQRTAPADPGAQPDTWGGSRMLDIWQDVMGRQIDIDDNFFDLGGNSLIGIRIASAMRKQGLPPLPLAELYTHQTVRKLAAALGME